MLSSGKVAENDRLYRVRVEWSPSKGEFPFEFLPRCLRRKIWVEMFTTPPDRGLSLKAAKESLQKVAAGPIPCVDGRAVGRWRMRLV